VTFPDSTPLNAANPTVHVHGVTEPNAGVSVVAGDGTHTTAAVTTTAAADDGSYDAFVDTTALSDGVVTLTATATDAAGNTSTCSNTKSKDATPPGTPSITVFDPVNKANVALPHTISGTAPAGTTVNVWVTDASNVHVSEVDGLSVDPSGNWTTTADVSTLASGPISAHAIAVDSSQNQSAEATKVTVKDVGVPAAPEYTTPTWVNGSTKSAVPLSGTAEPSTTLHLVVTDSGAGTTTVDLPVDGNGAWSTTLDLHTFAEGAVGFAATVIDQAGNVSPETDGTSTKDTVAPATPAAPALSAPAADTSVVTATGSGTDGDTILVRLTSDGGAGQATGSAAVQGGTYSDPVDASSLADGTLTGVATETDPAGNTSPDSPSASVVKDTTAPLSLMSSVPADGSVVKATPVLSATFNEQLDLAQSTVTLKDSAGAVLGHTAPTLSADKKTISVSPTNNPLSEASGYQVIFAAKDLSDSDSLTPTVTFTVDRTAPNAPTVGTVADASAGNVAGVPVTGFATEPGGTITVTLTDGTHNAAASVPVAGDSTWATTVDASGLTDGPIGATATQADAAGNVSPLSPSVGAHKDTVAPAKPTLRWSGSVTEHAQTVVFSGTAEPGSTVAVSVDDALSATPPVSGTTPADGVTGDWSEPLSLSSLSDGTLTATAWATDAFGNVGAVRVVNGTKDTVAPGITLTAPRAPFSLGSVTARWRGSDATSGLAAAPYDVRWARQAHGKALSSYRRLASRVTATALTRTLSAGTMACFEVRAHDRVGNVSAWSVARCSTVALDDAAMTASPAWSRVSSRRLYHGSAFTTSRHGATLTLPASRLDRVAVVATKCRTCGSIAIFVGGHRIKLLDLHSATTHRRVLVVLAPFGVRRAAVTIKVISSGKQVQIDGVGTSTR
jgi:large repetitive protein